MPSTLPKVGDRRLGRNIDYKMVFGPDIEDDGIPHAESVEWVRQFFKQVVGEEDYFLIVCVNEDSPEQIWHGHKNNINSYFTCLYADEEAGK